MIILTMTILPFLASIGHGQNLQIFQQFQQISTISTTKISEVVEMVMIKFGLTILTIVLQFGQMVKNRGHWTPPIYKGFLKECPICS
jgi:hypothetical protein